MGELLQVPPQRRTPPTLGVHPLGETPASEPTRKERALGRSAPERLRGPQGTPSTFKKVTSTLAPQPQTACVLREVQPAESTLPRPPATAPRSPGQPSGHPAPTSPGASPLGADPSPPPPVAYPAPRPPQRPEPATRPPASRTPPCPSVPGAGGLRSSVTPHPSPAPLSPSLAPGRNADLTPPAPKTQPHRLRPSPGLRSSWRAHTRCSQDPPPALCVARRRLLQPGTRRDIRARIPTPGLFLGDRPGPDRNSFLHARMRTRREGFSVPPPASPSRSFLPKPSRAYHRSFLFGAALLPRWALES